MAVWLFVLLKTELTTKTTITILRKDIQMINTTTYGIDATTDQEKSKVNGRISWPHWGQLKPRMLKIHNVINLKAEDIYS